MDVDYRVIHKRKSLIEGMVRAVAQGGQLSTDWYIAQHKRWIGWKTLGSFQTAAEAEACCAAHAEGDLLDNGGRIVSEFSRRDRS